MTVSEGRLAELKERILAMPMAQTLKLAFRHIETGQMELQIPVQDAFCFQPGQLQATAVFALADFAAVGAAATTLPPGYVNATIDASLKLVAPAKGSHLIARGRVINVARLLTVCAADVFALEDGQETLCATLLATARNVAATPAAA